VAAVLAALATVVGIACRPQEAPAPSRPSGAALPAGAADAAESITAADLLADVTALSSDDMEGRLPGSAGDARARSYLAARLAQLGLTPAFGREGWEQAVPIVGVTSHLPETWAFRAPGGGEVAFRLGDEYVGASGVQQPSVSIDGAEVVFVGYGIQAAEEGWDDFKGAELAGKVLLMLNDDPDWDETLFGGERKLSYGRWTYKYESAARQGAAAAIIIHDTPGAAYGWDVVKSSWSGAQFDLPVADDPAPRLPLQGWISGETAKTLFADAGLDVDKLRDAAGKRGFKSVPLGDARLDATIHNTIRQSQSRNVVARLRGSKRPDEAIVYSAHWDHLGVHAEEAGDNIYNGAIDNGTGVAGVLEIAEQFAVQSPKPERSVFFLLVTLEESGLLGSAYYAAHPVLPLADTVAVINIDALPVVGPTRDMVVVGLGNSELEDILRPISDKQGRVLVEEAAPEKGQFFRSDHFSFAKAGVPALYVKGGVDNIEKGRDAGLAMLDDYTKNRYHKASDNFDPNWDLRGIVQDLNALYGVGKVLSLDQEWPNYRKGNAFRAVRDASRASTSP
jgi:Zn-dependent M28 family amino/carboxypeptidase